jgi:hypothetical protein
MTDPTALVVAIIALAVSIVAAVFSGWQAVTAHLARTRPAPASWTVDYAENVLSQSIWKLHNTGGSTGTDVALRARNTLATNPEYQTLLLQAGEAIPAGSSRDLKGSENCPGATNVFVPSAGPEGHFDPAEAGTKGAVHIYDQRATVTWRDHRGKSQKKTVRLW